MRHGTVRIESMKNVHHMCQIMMNNKVEKVSSVVHDQIGPFRTCSTDRTFRIDSD
jgi:hypothetical protein